jgi:hypothetical protein
LICISSPYDLSLLFTMHFAIVCLSCILLPVCVSTYITEGQKNCFLCVAICNDQVDNKRHTIQHRCRLQLQLVNSSTHKDPVTLSHRKHTVRGIPLAIWWADSALGHHIASHCDLFRIKARVNTQNSRKPICFPPTRNIARTSTTLDNESNLNLRNNSQRLKAASSLYSLLSLFSRYFPYVNRHRDFISWW